MFLKCGVDVKYKEAPNFIILRGHEALCGIITRHTLDRLVFALAVGFRWHPDRDVVLLAHYLEHWSQLQVEHLITDNLVESILGLPLDHQCLLLVYL